MRKGKLQLITREVSVFRDDDYRKDISLCNADAPKKWDSQGRRWRSTGEGTITYTCLSAEGFIKRYGIKPPDPGTWETMELEFVR